ncbi:HNH endonuclease signature motif containing protein [Streptomyces sp. NBC_00083]|uniref:HNH endonuclease signature motif containing protein n=1 Tax=Streptomyces sp. NBC_00083 TaxID=2975647 RepID=UPI00224F5B5D|nr:HNH endonuclease signature motif containing protein [Streptomyces sp. NBC_00083]MCX5382206.1 HNH endonuclease [Streptomyces sp. NBC_00083]
MLRRLGAPMGSRPLRYLRGRVEHYGTDTSHFEEEPLPERAPRSYPKELLAQAAARSHSIREVIEYLGFSPRDCPAGYIRKRLDRFGIDTSHFLSGRSHGPKNVRRDLLESAVASSRTLAGVLRQLDIVDNGAGRARINRDLRMYGISTGHFVGQGHKRGVPSTRRKSADEILVLLPPGSARTKTAQLRRALDDLKVAHVCGACGVGDLWQGGRLVLEIDHVSGDRLDNRRENLRYLCPSCHSQTGTFSERRDNAQ